MKVMVLASGNLGFNCLEHIINQLVKPSMIACDSLSDKIIDLAKRHNIKLFTGNPRAGKLASYIDQEYFDLILSINYLFIIEQDVLTKANKAINFHGSLLPKYRGRTPHVWAIINNEKETGITAHLIDEGCDTGDIVLQEKVSISPDDTGATMLQKFAVLYPGMIEEIFDQFRRNAIKHHQQNHDIATYYGKRTPEDGQIDWNWQSERIRNWVRALSDPYPGAFSHCNGMKIIVDKVRLVEYGYNNDLNRNGEIIGFNNGFPVVKVPNGALELSKIRGEYTLKVKDILEYVN